MDDILQMYFVFNNVLFSGVFVCFFYGGLVKLDNVVVILLLDYVDGVLVGGVSLKVLDFVSIIKNLIC